MQRNSEEAKASNEGNEVSELNEAPEMPESHDEAVVHRAHVFGLREEGEGKPGRPRSGVRAYRQNRADHHPDGIGGGSARRQESDFAADVLSGLRAGGNGYGRLHLARGALDAAGDGLRRVRANAFAADRRRSAEYFEPRDHHGGEAETEIVFRSWRESAHRRRAVCEFYGRGGRSEFRPLDAEGFGDDFRTLDAGGIGFRAGGKSSVRDWQSRRGRKRDSSPAVAGSE